MPLNIDWQQILLHMFNLAILAGGLYFLLYNPVKKFIAKREEYYKSLSDETTSKLESAKELEEKTSERLKEIDLEIANKRQEAEAELEKYKETQIADSKKEAEKIISDARDAANAEKQSILDSADREIIEMTKSAAEKMLHKSAEDAFEQFLDIAERNSENE